MEEEVWKRAVYSRFPDLVLDLEVSNLGRIRKTSSKKLYSQYIHDKKYMIIRRNSGSVKKNFKTHIMVCETFVGERPEGHDIDHINGNRIDNRSCNLRYLPSKENSAKGNKPLHAEDNKPLDEPSTDLSSCSIIKRIIILEDKIDELLSKLSLT